ncbi:hypothetical protein L0128_06305 [candidate division KSB1 bacterium]|nr:hypothetical protein [candidate division KSB1 bacterium]
MKTSTHHLHVRRVALAILSYFREHPLAKDSVTGIAKFWVGANEEIVTEALALLLKEKVIEKHGEIYQLVHSAVTEPDFVLIEKVLKH